MMISIILPTYKPGKYLFECLDSIRCQISLDIEFEVILILNGPKEPYYNIIINYFENYNLKKIKLIYSYLKGVSNARNLGIENAVGKYILFLDDDDILSHNYLCNLKKLVNDEKILIVSNLKTFVNDIDNSSTDYVSKAVLKNYKNREFTLLNYRGFLSSSCGKLIPRKIIGNIRFNPLIAIGEDAIFMFKLSINFKNIYICADSIYYRRLRAESASRMRGSIIKYFIIYFKVVKEYTKIYFTNFPKYNFLFYCNRLFASTKFLIFKVFGFK